MAKKKPAKKAPAKAVKAPKTAESLTPKQQQFVQEYLIDLNATQAAIRSGYSEKTAKEQAARLLTNVHVAAAVQKAMEERSKRTQITADRVLEELALIAFSDVRHYNVDEAGRLMVTPDAPHYDVGRAVSSVKFKRSRYTGKDGDENETTDTEIKVWDKNTALQAIGKHLGMFKDRIEHSGPGGAPIRIKQEADLSKLSDEELMQLEQLAQRAIRPPDDPGGAGEEG